jgi:hypothetical protein
MNLLQALTLMLEFPAVAIETRAKLIALAVTRGFS